MSATNSVSVVQAKIERVIYSDRRCKSAQFMRDGEWFCCQAWVGNAGDLDRGGKIQARGTSMTPEQAAIVAVAIQMAIDWIAEELLKA
jgi:hypothetical protein